MSNQKRNSNPASIDPLQNHYELTRLNFNLLTKLVPWLDDHAKQDQKFKTAVVVKLSKIEAMLTELMGCQLAQYWPDGKVTEKQRHEYIKEVQNRISIGSKETGLKMVRFIYEESSEIDPPRDRRRKWSGWEI